MAGYGVFVLASVIYQVTAQCLPLPPQVTTTQLYCQPNPLPVATTIIDNSVSNSLANALQLLIVSDLIENTLNKERVVETSVCDLTPSVAEYAQFAPVVATGPSQVVEYAQFAPVVATGPSQVVEYAQFAPVVATGPSQVVEYAQFAPVAVTPQAQVVEYAQFAPVVATGPSQVVEYAQFAPVVEYAPPVVEYVQSPCGPLAAEVVFPGSFPAQLTCSLTYGTGAPVVNVVGVEAFAPTGCCGVPGYYY